MQGCDSDDASDSEQDSVSEDESAVKEHRRTIKAEQPGGSLVSQHSDVASQLGKHKHQLCESLPCILHKKFLYTHQACKFCLTLGICITADICCIWSLNLCTSNAHVRLMRMPCVHLCFW